VLRVFLLSTGVSAVDQDGAETGTPCANASHEHHHGLDDSVWQQYRRVRDLFHSYLKAPASYPSSRAVPPVGIIYGMPGSTVDAGQSKVPGGYSEMTCVKYFFNFPPLFLLVCFAARSLFARSIFIITLLCFSFSLCLLFSSSPLCARFLHLRARTHKFSLFVSTHSFRISLLTASQILSPAVGLDRPHA
jgi:hypothetical protein